MTTITVPFVRQYSSNNSSIFVLRYLTPHVFRTWIETRDSQTTCDRTIQHECPRFLTQWQTYCWGIMNMFVKNENWNLFPNKHPAKHAKFKLPRSLSRALIISIENKIWWGPLGGLIHNRMMIKSTWSQYGSTNHILMIYYGVGHS